MTTRIEQEIYLEDLIQQAAIARFPALDSDWVVKRHMDVNYRNTREIANVLMGMRPEVLKTLQIKR